MREYQVRICERLGVKFPGPTRQIQTHAAQQIPALMRREFFLPALEVQRLVVSALIPS